VPKRLAAVFEGRARLLRVAKWFDRLQQELASHRDGEYATQVQFGEVQRLLRAARTALIRGLPYEPCPNQDCIDGCDVCEGKQWVTVDQSPLGLSLPPRR